VEWTNSSQYWGYWRCTVNSSGHSASIKCGQFLDSPSNCQRLTKDFGPWSESLRTGRYVRRRPVGPPMVPTHKLIL
jgi:hypothetical protein